MTAPVPSAHAAPAARATAARRRRRYALQTAALLFAVTSVCVLVALLADRFPTRVDATATREHQLSERTRQVLASLKGPHEIIVAANFAQRDPLAVRRARDVLDAFGRLAPDLSYALVDVASPRGVAELDAALLRVVERYRPRLDRHRAEIERAIATGRQATGEAQSIADALLTLRNGVGDADPNGPYIRNVLTDDSSRLVAAVRSLETGAAGAEEALGTVISGTPVPALDAAQSRVREPLATLASELSRIDRNMEAIVGAAPAAAPEPARAGAAQLRRQIAPLRDTVARTLTGLDDLPRLPLLPVARALSSSSVAVVIGPPDETGGGIAAVDIETLFPPAVATAGSEPAQPGDRRARTEELLLGGIAAVSVGDNPILVIVHGENARVAPHFQTIAGLVQRLELRGVTVLEWAVALDSSPPPLAAASRQGQRRVVYAVVPTEAGTAEGAIRSGKLAGVLDSLLARGEPVLVSLAPSTLPSYGAKDPMAAGLSALGIGPDTARPLLRKITTPRAAVVTPDMLVTEAQTDHPIGAAVNGLRVWLPWALPLRARPDAEARITPLLTIPDDNATWAESEWVEFRNIPPAQRAMIINPPAEDSARDDGSGPWTVAAALERTVPETGAAQRVVVVGSSLWFWDAVAQTRTPVEGRQVLTYPGNAELYEAGVYWLAGRESVIGASAEARTVPLIPPLSGGAIAAIRWALIAGLPILVLLIGAVWRLVRG